MAIDKTIKIPRGNSFILEVPIVERLYTGGKPVDEPVSPDEFSDWSVTVERFDTRERVAYRNFTVSAVTSVRITFDETLPVGYYNVIIGAKRGGGDVSQRMRKCFEIVEWNSLSNFEDYVAGSPVLIPAQPLLPLPQNLPLKPGTGKNSLMQSGAKEASGDDSVAFGRETEAMGPASVAEGKESRTSTSAHHAHAEGLRTLASQQQAHAEGAETSADGTQAHAEGYFTNATGHRSHAEGQGTRAEGKGAHAEGYGTVAIGEYSHSEGNSTVAEGASSHAEGVQTKAISSASHAEGRETTASGTNTHAEGFKTRAAGYSSHAEGQETEATAPQSHAEGLQTIASGDRSHAEGYKTITKNKAEHAEGTFNLSIPGKTVHSVGIGNGDSEDPAQEKHRKNAEEIHTDGKQYIIGVGGYDGTNSTTEGTKSVQEVIGSKMDQLTRITWNELKSLRDNSKLVAGGMYRITDYNCILPDTMTEVKSAGHQFDIIVLALSKSELSAQAWAALHEGDTYFADCDLSKWQLWYDINNDTTKYEWAAENGRGVIYRMIDEFNNDAPYDFKNIMTKMYKISANEYNDILNGKYLRMSNSEWNLNNYPLSKIQYDADDYRYAYLFSLFDSDTNEFTDMSLSKFAKNNSIGFDLVNDNTKKGKLQNCAFIVFKIGGKKCSINDNKLGATCMYNVLAAIDTTSNWGANTIYNNTCDVNVSTNLLVNCSQCSFGSNSKYNMIIDAQENIFGRYCQRNCVGLNGLGVSFYSVCGERWTDNIIGCMEYVRFDEACRYNRFAILVRTTFDSYSQHIRTVNPDNPDALIGLIDKSKFLHNSSYVDIVVSDNTAIANHKFVALNGSASKSLQIEPQYFKKGYMTTISRRKGTGEIRQYNEADLDCRLAECVTTDSEQVITKLKAFKEGIAIGPEHGVNSEYDLKLIRHTNMYGLKFCGYKGAPLYIDGVITPSSAGENYIASTGFVSKEISDLKTSLKGGEIKKLEDRVKALEEQLNPPSYSSNEIIIGEI